MRVGFAPNKDLLNKVFLGIVKLVFLKRQPYLLYSILVNRHSGVADVITNDNK